MDIRWTDRAKYSQRITTPILERLLHWVEVIQMDGESYRMNHKEKHLKVNQRKCPFLLSVSVHLYFTVKLHY